MTRFRDASAPDQPLRWPVLFFMFGLLALTLMVWRWGGTIEDSQAYFDTARWFRGEVGIETLRAPFPTAPWCRRWPPPCPATCARCSRR
jgi:hypothetical protein